MAEPTQKEKLEPRAIFGINGEVECGLRLHPDNKHLIFPLGIKLSITNIQTNKQEFVSGHTNTICCLDISSTGKYMATGQINHMGFRAYVIVWDFETRKEIGRHDLHKVRVQSLCFSAEERYIFSIGGQDDGSVIVYDMETNLPICRAMAGSGICGFPSSISALHHNSSFFIVAGDRHLRMWSIEREVKKLHVHDVHVGKQQRRYTSVRVDRSDEYIYLGTMTGDIVKVVLNCCDLRNVTKLGYVASLKGAYGTHNPRKPFGKDCNRYVNGVRNLIIVDEGLLLVGAGDGTLELIEERKDVTAAKFKDYPSPTWPMFRMIKSCRLNGSITSLVKISALEYYACTNNNEIYSINIKTFTFKLLKTCHLKAVRDIKFPRNLPTVFATAGYESIRIWAVKRLQELLRIMVYNFECAAICFSYDGSSILSAWNDGIIRSFTPITGRLIFAIPNAHNKGCSALIISKNGRLLVTGGIEGQVRFWKIEPICQSLIGIVKDHSGPVTSLDFNHDNTEVISASSDGSCVIWDVERLTRKQVIFSNTQFMGAMYYISSMQLITCGSDGRISYWMTFNGNLIREFEASKKSSINSIDINPTGEFFLSAGSDQLVKLWDYNEGTELATGSEHASSVISVTYSPCGKFFVTGGSDGSVIIWDIPEQFRGDPNKPPIPELELPVLTSKSSKSKLESSRSNTSTKKENINGLIANTKAGEICCVECPAVKASTSKNECDFIQDVRKC